MRGEMCGVTATCGLGLYYDFLYQEDPENQKLNFKRNSWAGADFNVVGFIDAPTCKKVYEKLCKHQTLVYQSPVRCNRNSGNMFFFCIFDQRKAKK